MHSIKRWVAVFGLCVAWGGVTMPLQAAVLEGRIVLEAGTPQHRSKSVLNPFTAILGETRAPQHAVIDPRDGVVWTEPVGAARLPGAQPAATGRLAQLPAVMVVRVEGGSRGEEVPQVAEVPRGSNAGIRIEGSGGFRPHVVAVVVGSSVVLRNDHGADHTLRVDVDGDPLDLGTWASGQSRSLRFTRPGPVHLTCTCHEGPGAWIYVTPTRDCARPDAQGRFHIAGVASGRHRVHVWHPQRGVRVHEVEVGPAGTHVEIRY